jgi:flagellar protein FlgJ
MMLKSMREATSGDPIFGSDQEKFYQGMFDDQMAVNLSKGHGLGLGDMLVKQLTRAGLIPAAAAGSSDASNAGTTTSRATAASSATGSFATTTSLTSASNRAAPGRAAASWNPAGWESFVTTNSKAPTADIAAGTIVSAASAFAPANLTSSPSSLMSPSPLATPLSQEDFVKAVWPAAKAAGNELGVDPRSLIAQAALETGWGRSIPNDASGNSSFNLFGVKSGTQWSGSSVAVKTLEFEGGVPVPRTDKFRAYASANESFNDYVALLRDNPRYADALNTGSDTKAFAAALQRGGYATDPAYAQKLTAIAQNVDGMTTALKSDDIRPMTTTTRML